MNRRRLSIFLILAACAVLLAWIVVHQQRGGPSKDELVVGVILPQTGILAQMGQCERQAMDMAVDDLRSSGFAVRLVYEDGKGDNKSVALAANKLVDVDRVPVLITSTTGASFAAQPIAERAGTLQLAFCMSSDLAPKNANTIRFYVGIEEEAKAICNYLKSLPRDTQVGILHGSVAAWTEAIRQVYQPFCVDHFSKPVIVEEYDIKAKDFRAQLARLKSSEVRVLIMLGYGFEYGPIFDQMTELGLRKRIDIVGGWGFLYTALSSEQLEGVHVAGPTYVFERRDTGSAFEQAFRKRYGVAPNFDAAFAYEMIRQLPRMRTAMKGQSVGAVKPALVGWGTTEGVMGKYRFEAGGNLIAETAVGRVTNGVLRGE